jgi:hypothetical protein
MIGGYIMFYEKTLEELKDVFKNYNFVFRHKETKVEVLESMIKELCMVIGLGMSPLGFVEVNLKSVASLAALCESVLMSRKTDILDAIYIITKTKYQNDDRFEKLYGEYIQTHKKNMEYLDKKERFRNCSLMNYLHEIARFA